MEPVESIIFIRKQWMTGQMSAYGFQKQGDSYVLKKTFFNGDFLSILSVDATGQLTGRVLDTMTQDDYDPLYQKNAQGAYVSRVRAAYVELLEDIAACCCRDVLFAQISTPLSWNLSNVDRWPMLITVEGRWGSRPYNAASVSSSIAELASSRNSQRGFRFISQQRRPA